MKAPIQLWRAAALVLTLQLIGLVPALAQPRPIVVISHGFSLTETLSDWMFQLADEMRDRLDAGEVRVYEPVSGAFGACTHPACDDPPSATGPIFLIMDWAEQSNDPGSGFSEAAAEALTAALVESAQAGAEPEIDLSRVHLIGHSRGAVVSSEVAERLIAAGFPPPAQLTTLDPHDSGGGLRQALASDEQWHRLGDVRGGFDDLDVNQEHPEYSDNGIVSWSELGAHDNYWRTGCLPDPFDPDGELLAGASNFDMSDTGDAQGNNVCHSDVHSWYRLTVSQASAPAGWFDSSAISCSASERTTPLAQSVDGFNGSPLLDLPPACPGDPAQQQDVLFRWDFLEGIVNGGFERRGSGSNTHAGWSYDGGGGTGTIEDGELVLTTGQHREHSRLLVPAQATHLQVCWRAVEAAGQSDLRLSICAFGTPGLCGDRAVWSLVPSAPAPRRCALAPLLESERGRGARLRFDLLQLVSGADADVRIDEVRWQRALFGDGFESGTFSFWSETSP